MNNYQGWFQIPVEPLISERDADIGTIIKDSDAAYVVNSGEFEGIVFNVWVKTATMKMTEDGIVFDKTKVEIFHNEYNVNISDGEFQDAIWDRVAVPMLNSILSTGLLDA